MAINFAAAPGSAAISEYEMARSVPAMRTLPSAISKSATAASSLSAAKSFSEPTKVSEARETITAPIGIDRDPPVPLPVGIRSVSPCTTLMRSIGTSRYCATIWA